MQNPTTPMPSPVTDFVRGEVVDRAAHVARGAIGRELRHQLRGLVHLGVPGELTVVEVGHQGDEALAPRGGRPSP